MRAFKWGWASEYPRALETDDTAACLSIRGRGTDTGLKVWEDTDCGEKLNFVCEYLWIQEYIEEQKDESGEREGRMMTRKEKEERMKRNLELNLVKVAEIRQSRAFNLTNSWT
ncbi:uncharacterized protein LOC111716133 [Eurytemora carolleeae]|uniref:uncharacterized protein LOC111716133 n=1 Tax=Eurytemora carolleeae TaxID=1294199 RepID=UPI000C791AB8|nr:uncharacterized protein LOC111716133 [Eurytemora carolleeae]|eukprot:XP_023347325.1 uncharacterized protein LOC111716133 [Eurytemora affinis]